MDISAMIEQGTASPVLLLATAVVLGALHGLEPGHSKTMMAAFIIAVRGTVPQAMLLGLSAAFSHTIVIWVLALAALTYGDRMLAEHLEPWILAISGIVILAIAVWVFGQTWRTRTRTAPHRHGHSHDRVQLPGDAHARAHAREIEAGFASGRATTGQVVAFGITGGLLPCAAAVTVLIVCLHLRQFWLGVGLVGAFSVGLAATLVLVGVAASVGVSAARKRYRWLDAAFARAPYVSAVIIAAVGAAMLASGVDHLAMSG